MIIAAPWFPCVVTLTAFALFLMVARNDNKRIGFPYYAVSGFGAFAIVTICVWTFFFCARLSQ